MRPMFQAQNEQEASTALAKGQEYFSNQQYDKALKGDGAGYVGFVNIASDYSSTDAGKPGKPLCRTLLCKPRQNGTTQ